MFKSARLKLTGWYLLIIMLISILFSMVIYAGINREYDRFERNAKLRLEREKQGLPSYEEFRKERQRQGLYVPPMPQSADPGLITQARTRLQIILLAVNLVVLGVAGLAAYFLAGRTMRPIAEMVEEQNRFITDASHELRTPLTSLKSEIEVNLRDKKLTLAQAKNLLKSNLEEVNNLGKLSDNLIKLTQYQKTNNHINFEKVSLLAIIQEAQKKVTGMAKGKNIMIRNRVKDCTLKADLQSLCELFVILLDNAIKYSPKNKSIIMDSRKVDHVVAIDVKDQGIGIDKEDIPHLFDRFYRSDKSRAKGNVQGYGLGLSIAKQIVDRHEGLISVKSEIGKGTNFTIELPM